MSPSLLARRARERGVSILALSDHNAALNCPAFAEACAREGLAPLFGIEACSREEVHVLCLFGGLEAALDFGELLATALPGLPNDPERLGDQVVVDVDENVLDQPQSWLGAALALGLDEIGAAAAARGALVVPAHVDRPLFSVSSQLGFLPEGPWAAVEALRDVGPALSGGRAVISGSDAHVPVHIGRRAFLAALPEGIVEARAAAGTGREAPRAGEELVAALAAALAAGAVTPSWRRGR
jgi:hypothetical protein